MNKKEKLEKKKDLKVLLLTVLGIIVLFYGIIYGGIAGLNAIGIKSLIGGKAEPSVIKTTKNELEKGLKEEGYKGKVTELKEQHFGLDRGGIDGSFVYREQHGKSIIDVPVEFHAMDDGTFNKITGDSSNGDDTIYDVIDKYLPTASLQQKSVKREQQQAIRFFKHYSNKANYKVDGVNPKFNEDMFSDNKKSEHVFSQSSNVKDKNLNLANDFIKNYARNNHNDKSNKKKQYVNGFYDIPINELKNNNIYSYDVNLIVRIKGSDDTEHNQKYEKMQTYKVHEIKKALVTNKNNLKLPDGTYNISIDGKNLENGNFGLGQDFKIIVSSGKFKVTNEDD